MHWTLIYNNYYKKDIFCILNFFPDEMNVFFLEYLINNSSNSFQSGN